ncbi:MAG: hypothetical protein LBD73_02280, partial [Deferribacteraceae bacterium]|nr:hypothetical protein [Deferribacteraceae bacterium]
IDQEIYHVSSTGKWSYVERGQVNKKTDGFLSNMRYTDESVKPLLTGSSWKTAYFKAYMAFTQNYAQCQFSFSKIPFIFGCIIV